MSYLEATVKRIMQVKGVKGALILNKDGSSVKSTFDAEQTVELNKFIGPLSHDARSAVRNLDPSEDLRFLRIRTTTREIIVAKDREFTIIVVQNPIGW